jgi:hypothetical protein
MALSDERLAASERTVQFHPSAAPHCWLSCSLAPLTAEKHTTGGHGLAAIPSSLYQGNTRLQQF